LRWDGEEGGEGKEEEKWADSVINVEEEKEGGEDAAAAERDAKTGFKISNMKRRPPPKEKQRRRPPGLKIEEGKEEKTRRRNPLKLKGTPKGVKPGSPVRGRGAGGEEEKLEEEKQVLMVEEKLDDSASEEDDNGATPQMYNDSAPLKMQVMECIASSNPSRLKSVLSSREVRSSDVYPGLVNCVLKGFGGILSILLSHAGEQGRQSALVLAVRRANVDCSMRTLDAIIQYDGNVTWRLVERAVERAVGEVDDEGKGLGRRILLRTIELGKTRGGHGNMDWKRILLKLATKGAKAAVDMVTALMEEHDAPGRLKIYNSVAVKAIFKKRVEALPSLLKLMGDNNRNISSLLSQCAAKNEVKGCQAVLATGAIGKDALGRAIDVAKGKGADDALAVLKAYGV
jgi:hypothetical protein